MKLHSKLAYFKMYKLSKCIKLHSCPFSFITHKLLIQASLFSSHWKEKKKEYVEYKSGEVWQVSHISKAFKNAYEVT